MTCRHRIASALIAGLLALPALAQDDQQISAQGQPPAPCPYDDSDVSSQATSDIQSCKSAHDSAQSCCQNPSSCLFASMTAGGGSDMQKLVTLMMTVEMSQLMAQSSPGQMNDMAAICSMFGGMTGAGGTMNNNGSSMCNNDKQQCVSACSQKENTWKKMWNDARQNNACNSVLNTMNDTSSKLSLLETDCQSYNAPVLMNAQANNFSGANQGAMQNACAQMQQMQPQAQLQPLQPPQQMVDCTNPVLAASPACQACAQAQNGVPCTQAQAVHDTPGGNPQWSTAPFVAGGNASNYNTSTPFDTVHAGARLPGLNNNSNQQNNAAADPYGYGMMPGMYPGGTMQMLNSGYRPPTPAPVYRSTGPKVNTDILQGERGGNGYTNNNMIVDTSSGGFQGYGSAPQQQAASTGIDLRKYLPGHSLDPNRRIAGVGSATPEIATTGTDIFKRISDRFKLICSSNRLLDCEIPQRSN